MSNDITDVEFAEIKTDAERGARIFETLPMDLLKDVTVKLSAYVGDAEISIAKLSELSKGDVVKISNNTDAVVSVILNGKSIARGKLVIVDDSFGVQLTEVPKL